MCYLKTLLLFFTLILTFPHTVISYGDSSNSDSNGACEDDANFAWKPSPDRTQMTCADLTTTVKKNKWCIKTVQGLATQYNYKCEVEDKCKKVCNNCETACQDDCNDSTSFRWRDSSESNTDLSCNWIKANGDVTKHEARVRKYCKTKVTIMGGQGEGYVNENCPKSCNNCCH
jgi:hypothetical protein